MLTDKQYMELLIAIEEAGKRQPCGYLTGAQKLGALVLVVFAHVIALAVI